MYPVHNTKVHFSKKKLDQLWIELTGYEYNYIFSYMVIHKRCLPLCKQKWKANYIN